MRRPSAAASGNTPGSKRIMGADGWVAFDPTTGELESMSATHIKLFEGMGGVIPDEGGSAGV